MTDGRDVIVKVFRLLASWNCTSSCARTQRPVGQEWPWPHLPELRNLGEIASAQRIYATMAWSDTCLKRSRSWGVDRSQKRSVNLSLRLWWQCECWSIPPNAAELKSKAWFGQYSTGRTADTDIPTGRLSLILQPLFLAFLGVTFTSKWTGRGGPTAWPPRSPDITL